MDNDEKLRNAKKIYGDATIDKTLDSDHPLYLSLLALRDVILTLADDENEAFTQLNMGTWKNLWIDETKDFALAIHYAQHPLDDIGEELTRRGIVERHILNEVKVNKGQEAQYIKSLIEGSPEGTKFEVRDNKDETVIITKYIEKPLRFVNRPLGLFAHEWMKRRVPANRKRVAELIELAGALSERLGSLTATPQTSRLGGGIEPPRRV